MADDALTIETALDQADGHAARINAAQSSPTFLAEFDDPDEEDDDEDEIGDITRANAEDGERPE